MDKLVIYKDIQGFKVTTEKNYNNYIQDANKITDLKDFDSVEAIINYFIKYCNKNKNDFIIKC